MPAFSTLSINGQTYHYVALKSLNIDLSKLPFSIRILLESVLRNADGFAVTEQDVNNLAAWTPELSATIEIPFKPARVLLQDFTGVPAVVDLAAMRHTMKRLGGDPDKINPLIPVDLVIDHSIQTDFYGTPDAALKNIDLEFKRNAERYALLHWAQKSLSNFRVVPPSVGIIHQVNLEFLADVVHVGSHKNGENVLYPDSVLGTDSHTVMINGLGVLGWGVGGIEAEAVMLGQPYYMLAPQVVGFELTGKLRPGVTATDLVLAVTEILRNEGVVGKFVEYFGDGAATMPLANRAVLANMAPEYGATMGFFPVDENTIRFLRETGRDEHHVALVETYCKTQQLFRSADQPTPRYTKIVTLDLSMVEPSLAGPRRPQDRVPLSGMKQRFAADLVKPVSERGFGLDAKSTTKTGTVVIKNPLSPPGGGLGRGGDLPKDADTPHPNPSATMLPMGEGNEYSSFPLRHGAVVIASITSCTNTSNPHLMLAAGLLAKKAVEKGLQTPRYVKTSLAPGSRVVTEYLEKAGLLKPLEMLGFNVVGYGCLTCIGNSGPLPPEVEKCVAENRLVAAAVLSGNRNFEGRIHPHVRANFLASPPLVVAYALAGHVDMDLTQEPMGHTPDGQPVFLHEIWPSDDEVAEAAKSAVDSETYGRCYNNIFEGNATWNAIPGEASKLYAWDKTSTYVQEPPYLADMRMTAPQSIPPIHRARCLALLGNSVTTDHISPAGSIEADSPAGRFLLEAGVSATDFNSYGSRRGNDRVMTRGTFANIRIRNQLVPGSEGGITRYFGSETGLAGETMPIYDAAMLYKKTGTPLVVLAGSEYGTGSSRDWAAKGTALLGVKAVIAQSFERIHRGNLVGMGVLPLEFANGATWQTLNLTGEEEFSIQEITKDFKPGDLVTVTAEREVSPNFFCETTFQAKVRIDTLVELQYYLNGGVLQAVLRNLAFADTHRDGDFGAPLR